jgi:hypothetical protein
VNVPMAAFAKGNDVSSGLLASSFWKLIEPLNGPSPRRWMLR